eukprot:TRINITY_DN3795_c0_g2_i2.p1 TRINITY_DN3795_c0_g2~~TRINITY_DN3795_c0_g2_i2.p1  ORF type:complete len:365 (-),score=108.97 TRINITY_DN3795_c0_g2_i2:77-1171(-)
MYAIAGHLIGSSDNIQYAEMHKRATIEFFLDSAEELSPDFVLVPLDVIRPSEFDGLSLQEESNLRLFACELVQEAGIMLKLPQVTIATAMELLHRLFFRCSFVRVSLFNAAGACLFLATKLEETPKKIRDVISVLDHLIKLKRRTPSPVPVLNLDSDEFALLRKQLVKTERLLLRELGFALTHLTVKPYKYLYYYLKVLKLDREFAQTAWNYINDVYRTAVCVSFPPHVLAVTAIYLSSHALNVGLPEVEWWLAFDCCLEDIEDVAAEILSLYQMKKVTIDYVTATIKKYEPQFIDKEIRTPETNTKSTTPTTDRAEVAEAESKPKTTEKQKAKKHKKDKSQNKHRSSHKKHSERSEKKRRKFK